MGGYPTSPHQVRVIPDEILVMRHSDRIDHIFPDWTTKVMIGSVYSPYDLNMPLELPIDRPFEDYTRDPPITINGQVLAKMIGRALKRLGKKPDIIYCSPSLRCIQTADIVRRSAESPNIKIRVEPALFEHPHTYTIIPTLLKKEQRAKFMIDETYQPFTRLKDLFRKEELIDNYKKRLQDVLLRISATAEEKVDPNNPKLTVLVVGHASTVDMAMGILNTVGRKMKMEELCGIGMKRKGNQEGMETLRRQDSLLLYSPLQEK